MFAQSLGEYGATNAVGSGFQQLAYNVQTWVTTRGPATWLAVGAVVVLLLIARRRA
jgi:hypothetical protein